MDLTIKRLENHSDEIPLFLRRAKGVKGVTWKHPGMPVPFDPAGYRPVTAAPDPEAERIAAAAERDKRAAALIEREQSAQARERSKQNSEVSARKRKLDKERKTELQKSQRKNFLQNFRWEFDK